MADAGRVLRQALALHRQGRIADAIPLYRKAIRNNPRLTEAHANLGAALFAAGRTAEAVGCFERAAEARPDDVRSLINLAAAYQRTDRSAAAAEALARAYVIAPDEHSSRDRLLAALARGVPTAPEARVGPALDALANDPLVDPHRLIRPVLARLKDRPAVITALSALSHGPLPADTARGLAQALSTSAVQSLLRDLVIPDRDLETLLTALRAACLLAPADPPAPAPVAASIALQALATDWAWAETPAESGRVADLQRYLSEPAARRSPDGVPPALLVYAMYRPLWTVTDDGDVPARDGTIDAVDVLLRRHLLEPAQEAEHATAMARLTPVSEGVSTQVRAQYEESPYPRWRRIVTRPGAPLGDVLTAAVGDPDLRNVAVPAPSVLVAGCGTGRHACATATRFAGSRVLAVDLSLASLGYAARMAEALGIDNVTFTQADILSLAELDQRFDVIECSGVLHHMADPEDGWRILRGLLSPQGFMRIALYSERGRAGVTEARALVDAHDLTATPEDIRTARSLVRALPETSPARVFTESADFYSLAGCRDMLFHMHEERFTLPRIAAMLMRLNLRFLGFELPDPRILERYRSRFPSDPHARDLGNWDRLEAEHPTLFAAMFQFWCRAPE